MKTKVSFTVDSYTRLNRSTISKIFRKQERLTENLIDWDISVMLLDEKNKLIEQNAFIFFNNPVFSEDVVVLNSSIMINCHSEFDEEVIIDFTRIPNNVSHVLFFLSNHQKSKFEIAKIEVSIFNLPPHLNEVSRLNISNDNVGNALELFRFSRKSRSDLWGTNILNVSILENNGMEFILNKYFSIID